MADNWFISLENFKSIHRLERLEGRPITLLLGSNNAGKTSLLQALLLLKGSLAYPEAVLSFRNDLVNLGSFRETVTQDCSEEGIAITTGEESDGKEVWRLLLRVDTQEGTLQIRECELDGDKRKRNGTTQQFSFRYSRSLSVEEPRTKYSEYDQERASKESQVALKNLRWRSFLPYFRTARALNVSGASQDLQTFFSSLRYIGPLRVYPERSYSFQPPPGSDVGIDGRWAPHILRRADPEKESDQLQELRRWLGPEGFGLVEDIRTRQVEQLPGRFLLEVKIQKQWVNLRDVGFGMSQLLPIVVESIFHSQRFRPSMLLLEQPEIHLHPEAQAELTTFVIEMARERRQRFLIETHSHYLVMRLATEVRRGKLSPDDIAIYFLSLDEKGHTQFQLIPLEKDGRLPPPKEWPEGFFDTDIKEADAFLFTSPVHAET